MTAILTNINAALNTQLSTLSNLPPVQWPNIDYMPIEGTLFLRPTLLPATGNLSTLQGSYLHKGMYQIDIFCPLNQGLSYLTQWQDSIFNLFSGNKTLTSNGVTVFIQDIVQGKGQREEGWYIGFITIYYQCYT